jgi:hypothetical protein
MGSIGSPASIALDLQTQDLARDTLDADFHRATTHLAVNREALKGDAGIHGGFERLATKRAANGFNPFHVPGRGSPQPESRVPGVGGVRRRPAPKIPSVL